MKNTLNIDWLQLYLKGTAGSTKSFTLVDTFRNTRNYSKWFFVKYCDEIVFDVLACPQSSILPRDAISLKVRNYLLYSMDLFNIIDLFIAENSLIIKNVTRCDFCIDFVCFDNGIFPDDFMMKVAKKEYLYNCNSKITLHGETNRVKLYNSMSLGCRSSDIYVTLYNKSLELTQVKDKNYIREIWKLADLGRNNDVYRLEFSLKSLRLSLADKESGSICKLSYLDLRDRNKLNEFIELLINSKFVFKNNTGNSNKSREHNVNLFNIMETKVILLKNSRPDTTSRINKIMLKHFCEYIIKLPENKLFQKSCFKSLLIKYAEDKRLTKYYDLWIKQQLDDIPVNDEILLKFKTYQNMLSYELGRDINGGIINRKNQK